MESLIGVAVGVLLSGVAAWLSERRQSKRSDRKQWHLQRLAAYTTAWTRLSDVAMATQGLVMKYGKPQFLGVPWAPIRVLQQAIPIQTAVQQASEALTVIRFIGSKEVVDAADLCADVIVRLGGAIEAGDATSDQVQTLVQEMNKRRHHLVDVARIELDVDPRAFRRRKGSVRLGGSAERVAALDSPIES
jgi:hypothetical protein